MEWLFDRGKAAKELGAWRFIRPAGFGLFLYVISFAVSQIQEEILRLSRAPAANNQLTMLDWISLGTLVVGFLVLMYSIYQAYQDFVHDKWQEDAWRYRHGDYF